MAEELSNSELERRSEKPDREIEILLKLTNELYNEEKYFNWMINQLYLLTLEKASFYKSDGGLLEARGRYFYGCFLADKQNRFDEAVINFSQARHLCIGKIDWTVSQTDYRSLMKEICTKYYAALLQASQKLQKSNLNQAFEFIKNAIKIAHESDIQLAIVTCYLQLGKMYVLTEKYDKAKESFNSALHHSHLSGDPELICETYFQMAIGEKEEKDLINCVKHLNIMRRTAEKKQLNLYLGECLMLQGQIFLCYGQTKEASENLIKAVEIFNEINLGKKLRQARCLAAISIGQGIMDPFIETVLKSDKDKFGNNHYMSKLLLWKAQRETFWDYFENSDETYVSRTDTTFSINSITEIKE